MTDVNQEGPLVLVERRDAVGVVTLNRPAKLNALSMGLMNELEAALRELDDDPSIGAIVLTGAGERAFSAGGDMAEQVAAIDGKAPARRGSSSNIVHSCRTPTIAAIRGYCYGGAALLAVNCDMRIGAPDARFKFHGASYGRALGGAMLPRVVGEAKAKELLFTGDEVPAAEALRIGLLNHVVPVEELLPFSIALGSRVAANSPAAVLGIKDTIDQAMPTEQAQWFENTLNRDLTRSEDSTSRFLKAAKKVIG